VDSTFCHELNYSTSSLLKVERALNESGRFSIYNTSETVVWHWTTLQRIWMKKLSGRNVRQAADVLISITYWARIPRMRSVRYFSSLIHLE